MRLTKEQLESLRQNAKLLTEEIDRLKYYPEVDTYQLEWLMRPAVTILSIVTEMKK